MNNKELISSNNNYGIYDTIFDNFFKLPSLKNDFKDFDRLMKTDIQENENGYILEIDMPGIKKENINIELNNGYLTIATHKDSKASEVSSESYVRRERFMGNIARTFYIGDIDEKCIKANLENGVLNINIPKQNCCNNKRRIEIM